VRWWSGGWSLTLDPEELLAWRQIWRPDKGRANASVAVTAGEPV
jgi:hypothetical protein